ncbi:MAG: HAMP domain-containing sensor histidine kinase [bacterium]
MSVVSRNQPAVDSADTTATLSSPGLSQHWTEVPPRTKEDHSLQALIELSTEIHTAGDLYRVAELGLLKFMGHLGTASAALWVVSRQTAAPVLIRSLGISEAIATTLGEICVPDVIVQAQKNPGPAFVSDHSQILVPEALALAKQAKIELFGTLFSSGKPIGTIALGKRVSGEPYDESQLRVLEASLHHLGVALDNTLLYAGILEQNRELRTARERMRELDKLKQEFLDNMQHEVRTPLNIILSYSQLALETVKADDPVKEMLGTIKEQTTQLRGMMENLLTFRKIQENDLALANTRQDLVLVVRRFFDERRPGVALGLRELTFRCRPDMPGAVFDVHSLIQILDALVENAAKFTPQGSQIRLRLSQETIDDQEWVQIEVEDNGPGIPADQLQAACEPFRQLDGSMTRQVGGMGLGLTLSVELARKMGGELKLASMVGKGTSCRLLLPTK